MKNIIVLVCKSILLYTTAIVTMIYIAGIDSINDNGHFFKATALVAGLIFACYKILSEKDIETLTFQKHKDNDRD